MKEMLCKLDRAKELLKKTNLVCFTTDVDWASEYAIEQTLTLFQCYQVPATVFVTHKSEVIDRARAAGQIKCGIHPNFMPDSSQGGSYQEVIDFCLNLLPDARIFRAHRYYDVNDIMELLAKRGIVCESNVCTLMDILPPYLHRSNTVGFPIFWEDGACLYHDALDDYDTFYQRLLQPGLKVINIHPMHIMLNTPYFHYMREIKDRLSREEWNHLDAQAISKIAYQGKGVSNYIHRMLLDVRQAGIQMVYLEDVYDWIQTL